MSQGPAMSVRVRTFFVLAAICAVTAGLLAPAFSYPSSPARGAAVSVPTTWRKPRQPFRLTAPAPGMRRAIRGTRVALTAAWPPIWAWERPCFLCAAPRSRGLSGVSPHSSATPIMRRAP